MPPGFVPHYVPGNPAAVPPQPQPAPAPAKPAEAPAKPAAKPESAPPAASSGAPATPSMPVLNIQNASLTEVIDILARELKINYILDPRVRGGVTLQTYGEIKPVSPRAMLETVLRINGAAMVQVLSDKGGNSGPALVTAQSPIPLGACGMNVIFADTNAVNLPQRFYRAVSLQ